MIRHVEVPPAGYVRLRGVMHYFDHDGHELAVVNAARASYEKEVTVLGKRDIGLINFLVRRNEDSPFRHSVLAFGVRAPLMVARQWFKYAVGSSHLVEADATPWNETSRRYVSSEPEFYCPYAFLSAPDDSKQGSGEPLPDELSDDLANRLRLHQAKGKQLYEQALTDGVAPEQARLFLPAYGLYVTWVWTASLLAVLHFLDQRLEEKAQSEMRTYAHAVAMLTKPLFPHSYGLIEARS